MQEVQGAAARAPPGGRPERAGGVGPRAGGGGGAGGGAEPHQESQASKLPNFQASETRRPRGNRGLASLTPIRWCPGAWR